MRKKRPELITRGLAEMTRLGVALGADPATFAGLAGVGDLVLTCTGQLSRNRALGVEIGRGKTLDEALAGRETVAEGVITTRSAKALAERVGVRMPIVDAAFAVLFDGQAPRDAIVELMNRDPHLAPVTGVFAAQEIKPQARTLAEDRGIRCLVLDYDAMRGLDNDESRLF